MQPYPAPIEARMQRYYQSLSEKDRRRYAAIEAIKLGYGGQVYIRQLFGCHVKTLATGESEHRNEQFETIEQLKGSYQATGNPIMSMDTKKEN